MSKSLATKRKAAEGPPGSPTKKGKVTFAAESKSTKNSKVAASTASKQPTTDSSDTPPTKSILKVKQDPPRTRAYSAFFDLVNSTPETRDAAEKRFYELGADWTKRNASKGAVADKTDIGVAEPAPKPSVIKHPRTATSAIARKVKPPRKTAADFLSDDESNQPKIDKAVAKESSKNASAVVDKPLAAKKPDNIHTDVSAQIDTIPVKKTKKEKRPTVDAAKGKSKVTKDPKPANADDVLASRQLRAENGEPITPTAALADGPKDAEYTNEAAEKKVREILERLAIAKEKAAKKASRMSKTDKNGSKMKSANQDAGNKAETKLNKKTVNKNEDTSNSDVDQADDVSPESEAELLKGFDSDSPDDVQDNGVVIRETPPIVDPTGKIEQQLREAKNKAGPDDEPGAIYIGHIPHGFFEVQMRAFFSQFGDITRIRLSRNRRTGASKHFAFVEFASSEVAKIAAKTMDGYLMFGHILKSKFAPADSLHPDVWKGANKKFHKIPHAKLEGQKLAEPKAAEDWDKKGKKEEAKRKRKAGAAKEQMGYEAPAGGVAEAKKAKK